MTATANATDRAEVSSGGTISAPNGEVDLEAYSGDTAVSKLRNANGAILNVTVSNNPTAIARGDTEANLNGNVESAAGTSGAASLNVIANGNNTATAGMQESGGGLLQIGNSTSTAEGSPAVSITLGGGSSVIVAAGDIIASALSQNDFDSSTSSGTGGLLNVNNFTAQTCNLNGSGNCTPITPVISATVTGGAQITSDHGSISVDAASNQPPPPISDGTFNAGTQVNGANHTINFTCNGSPCATDATTGDAVTYQANGGGAVGGLTNGQTYSVIVTGSNAVQLGATFTASNVDEATQSIDFGARNPNLHTGDQVLYYQAGVGGASCAATSTSSPVGGLSCGQMYTVVAITSPNDSYGDPLFPNDYQVKLRPTSGFTATSVSTASSNVSSSTVNVTNAFHNGDVVTYQAPTPKVSFTSAQVGKTYTFASNGVVNGTADLANAIYFTISTTGAKDSSGNPELTS
ncbi:MAG: hypothetical protein ACRDNS_04220, partial [Trebonia sp.]